MALRGQPVSARIPVPWRARASAGSFLVEPHPKPLVTGSPRPGFGWVLKRLAEHGLIKGERIGVDASTIEANAALRTITRRDSGEGYREMLTRMAQESGIETPTAEDLVRLDRKRKGKKLSNADWESPTDPDARITKLKDGRT